MYYFAKLNDDERRVIFENSASKLCSVGEILARGN